MTTSATILARVNVRRVDGTAPVNDPVRPLDSSSFMCSFLLDRLEATYEPGGATSSAAGLIGVSIDRGSDPSGPHPNGREEQRGVVHL
jgi:hypothetical protein